MKSYGHKLITIIRKFNGIGTVLKFIRHYVIIRLPKTILTEDMEYSVLREVQAENKAELINRFYKKNEAGNVYILEESIERNKRKAIRNLLINCNYLHKNRIALILNL
jgi:hypothetical protein